MKIRWIILLLLILVFNLFSQNSRTNYYYWMEQVSFDPLSYDTHTIALYDGDLGLTTATWEDQKNNYDFTLVNTPTIVSGATFIRNDDSWNVNEWESAVTDTTFSKINIRDDTWTTVSSLIVPASTAISYWLAKEKLEGLRAYLTNTTGGNCRVIVEGNP